MNRYNILTIIIVFISILYMGSDANACVNELPIPVIANSYYQYSVVGDAVYFDGGDSYDPDDGTSPGDGITQWWWNVYNESSECIQVGLSGETTSYTFTQPGIYTIALWVKGDDGDDDWTPDPYAYADKCVVYVSAVTQPFWWYNGSNWEMTSGPVYVHVNQSIYICANGDPNTGSPDYYNYFPAGTPSWSISPTGPAINEYSSGYCYGGSYSDKVLVYNFPSPGTYTLTATAGTSSQNIDIVAFDVRIVSPYGDPTNPSDANSLNEIAFNSASPGVLTVECDALPTPNTAGVLAHLNDNRIRWSIDSISGSTLTWNNSWPGVSTKGESMSCKATFTGLPSSNSEFGIKQVKLEYLPDSSTVYLSKTKNIEVFYTRGAANNPGGSNPNWYYYWMDALFPSTPNVSYNAGTDYGSCNYASPHAIFIGDNSNAEYEYEFYHPYSRPTADGKKGIDLFYCVLTHELGHRADYPSMDGTPDTDSPAPDRFPDSVDPYPSTYNGAAFPEYTWEGDWEHSARSVENVTAPDDTDWSTEGKEWQH